MAARIHKELDVTSTLIPGAGGIFDVKVDDVLVYSKFETGRFPDEAMLVGSIRKG